MLVKGKFLFLSLVVAMCCSCNGNSSSSMEPPAPFLSEPHTKLQLEYLEDEDFINTTTSKYANGTEERSRPDPTLIRFSKAKTASKYIVTISENEDLSNPVKVIETTVKLAEVYNLKSQTKYYYKVATENETLCTSYFETSPHVLNNFNIPGVTNARDLGGYITKDGTKRVKKNLILRMARLNDNRETFIREDGINFLRNEIGIKSEIELRHPTFDLIDLKESCLGSDVNYIKCPIEATKSDYYPNNVDIFKKAYKELANPSNYPLLFHCTIGTDRTGLLAYSLLGICGIPYNVILRDYMFSNFALIGGRRETYSLAINQAKLFSYGTEDDFQTTMTRYLTEYVGIDINHINAIKDILLEDVK